MSYDLDLLRGGNDVHWEVDIPNTTAIQLISVEGISSQASFDSNGVSASVTIKVIDPQNEISVDSTTYQGLGNFIKVKLNGHVVWGGECQTITRTDDVVTLSLQGAISRKKSDTVIYNTFAQKPEAIYMQWICGACGFLASPQFIPPEYYDYTTYTKAYRGLARVAPPAMTLGSWPEPSSYEQPHVWKWDSVKDDQDLWREHSVDLGRPTDETFIKIKDFTPLPSGNPGDYSGASKNPLEWHREGSWYFNATLGRTETPEWGGVSPPPNCNWSYGRDQFVDVTGIRPPDTAAVIRVRDCGIKPSDTKEVKIRTSSNAKIAGQVITGILFNAFDFANWGKNYTKISQGTYESSRRNDAASIYHHFHPADPAPSWTSSDKVSDSFSFDDGRIGRMYEPDKSDFGATISVEYNHPDTSTWSVGISGWYDGAVQYSVQQFFTPTTILQEPWSETYAQQAAWIAGICPIEDYVSFRPQGQKHDYYYYIHICNLIPEGGQVYEIPLDTSTSSEWQHQQDNPLPKNIKLKTRDFCNNEHEILWQDYGKGTDEKEINILNGHILATDGGGEIDPNHWRHSPGQCVDRFSGVVRDGYTMTLSELPTTGDAWEDYGFGFLEDTGKILPCDSVPTSGSRTDMVTYDQYGVQDANGSFHNLFGHYLYMHPTGGEVTGTHKIDIMPLQSLKLAYERVYSLPSRPTYTCKATMNFALCRVGTVVVLKVPDYDNWLGIILGKSFGTNTAGVTLTIAPMHPITAQDYSDWTNLNDVMGHLR